MGIKVRRVVSYSDPEKVTGYSFFCEGCESFHMFHTAPWETWNQVKGKFPGPVWKFNEDAERPTFSPSLLIYEGRHPDGDLGHPRCHSFVRDGQIQFLGDCGHDLAGQTVDLLDIEAQP